MIFIDIEEPTQETIPPDWLEAAAQAALQHNGSTENSELTIVISDDAHLQDLNRQFLEIDAPTDVLSFPAGEEIDPDSGAPYLGDVILSLARAKSQAEAGGHHLKDELQLLVVHGVLHLLGYDHDSEDEKARMWSAQAEILSSLGCSITGPSQV